MHLGFPVSMTSCVGNSLKVRNIASILYKVRFFVLLVKYSYEILIYNLINFT